MSSATLEYHVAADAAPLAVAVVVLLPTPRPRVKAPRALVQVKPERLRELRARHWRCFASGHPLGCPGPDQSRAVIDEIAAALAEIGGGR
jgi:hypothetical protein